MNKPDTLSTKKYHELALIAAFAVVLAMTAPAADTQAGATPSRCDGTNSQTVNATTTK